MRNLFATASFAVLAAALVTASPLGSNPDANDAGALVRRNNCDGAQGEGDCSVFFTPEDNDENEGATDANDDAEDTNNGAGATSRRNNCDGAQGEGDCSVFFKRRSTPAFFKRRVMKRSPDANDDAGALVRRNNCDGAQGEGDCSVFFTPDDNDENKDATDANDDADAGATSRRNNCDGAQGEGDCSVFFKRRSTPAFFKRRVMKRSLDANDDDGALVRRNNCDGAQGEGDCSVFFA